MWRIGIELTKGRRATRLILQKVLGHIAHIFEYKREMFCTCHRIYNFVEEAPKRGWFELPSDILDELRAIGLHLPLAVSNLRAPFARKYGLPTLPRRPGAQRARAHIPK